MPVGHGGGGGGSHGGGFSGGHSGSFGGHSGGFGSHGGGFGSHGGGPRPGGFGGGPRPGGFFMGPGRFRHAPPPGGGGRGCGNGCGCGSLILLPLFLIVVLLLGIPAQLVGCTSFSIHNWGTVKVSEERTEPISPDELIKQRARLEASLCTETDYYHDAVGVIRSESELLPGLKEFYKVTGVQPYVCLMDAQTVQAELNASEQLSYEQAYDYAEQCYCELFHDEGHFLLMIFVYQQNISDSYWVDVIGSDACNVGPLDDEALTQLESNIDTVLYQYQALGAENQLSRIFSLSAQTLSESMDAQPMPSETESKAEPSSPADPAKPKDGNQAKRTGLIIGGTVAIAAIVVSILIAVRANRRKDEE